MRGFLIDPEVRRITRIEFSGDERTMVAMLGGDTILEAIPQNFDGALGSRNDALYVGEYRRGSGRRDDAPEAWFLFDVYPLSGA